MCTKILRALCKKNQDLQDFLKHTGIDRGQRLNRFRSRFGRVQGPDPHRKLAEVDVQDGSIREKALQLGLQLDFPGKITEPFLLVTVGSGAALNKVHNNDSFIHIDMVDRCKALKHFNHSNYATGVFAYSNCAAH